jgi:hypothetical protein
MMTFMHEGGLAMWATLIFFLASAATAIVRRAHGGDKVALAGAIVTLASGMLGMSTGLYNTVVHAAAAAADQRADILGIGIHESVNNTVFAAALGFILAVIGLVLSQRASRTPATAS